MKQRTCPSAALDAVAWAQYDRALELVHADAQLTVTVNGESCRPHSDLPRDPRYTYDNTKIWHTVTNGKTDPLALTCSNCL